MTMSAAISRPAVCVSDIMNMAGRCGKNIKYVTSQPFLFFTGKEQTKMAAPL